MAKKFRLAVGVMRASVLTLLLAVVLVGTLFGLASSEQGTEFFAEQLRSQLNGQVDWQELEGSLLGSLHMRNVSISLPGFALDIHSVSLDWQPAKLLQGELLITALQATGIQLALTATDSDVSDEPFNPAALLPPIDIVLQHIRLSELELLQDGQSLGLLDKLSLDVALRHGELTLQPLALELPNGKIKLTGSIRVSEAINFDLAYHVTARGLTELAPELPPQLTAKGQMKGHLLDDDLTLEQLSLALIESPLTLTIQGQMSKLRAPLPIIAGSLAWAGAQWPMTQTEAEADVTSAGGKLRLSGTLEAYSLELTTTVAGRDIPSSKWRGQGTGDLKQLQIDQFVGQLLEGELSLSGSIGWVPAPHWALRVEGRDLNPAALVPDLPGQLAFALHTTGQLDPDRGLLLEAEVKQLTGTLLDRPLELSAKAQIEGEAIQLEHLHLHSDGNSLRVSGGLSRESLALDWSVNATALGSLISNASGTLIASGKVTGEPQAPRLLAQLQGSDLQLDTLSLPTLGAKVEAGLGPDDPLSINLTTGPLSDGDTVLLESIQFTAHGSSSAHKLALTLNMDTEKVQFRLTGGLDIALNRWQGKLTALSVQSNDFGTWQLSEASELSLAADKMVMKRSCLQREAGKSRLCVQANWVQEGDARLKAALYELPLKLLTPTITGNAAGELEASLAANGNLHMSGTLRIDPGHIRVDLEQGVKQLAHGGGELTLNVDENGLAAKLHFTPPEQGKLVAELQLPAFTALPLPEHQPLAGQIHANLPDLSGLAAWIPELTASSGHVKADLQLAGTLEQPQFQGTLELLNGAADIPLAGLQLRDIVFRAESDPAHAGQLNLSGGMSSGGGQVQLSGTANLLDNTLDMQLLGENLQLYNTQDAHVLLSPDLQIGWQNDTLKLRGQFTIPEASITPKLQLSPAMLGEMQEAEETPGQIIVSSPDVVIINASAEDSDNAPPAAAPFRIDSQVQLVLGDHVRVSAMGFISGISGAVTFTNTPDQTELLPMAKGLLSVENGTFRAFGQDLEIETGQLIFTDVPVTEPVLNVRAVRWIDNDPQVTAAGVRVTGPVTEPVLEMFSRPPLDVSEIQSYLLTGRSSGDKNNVLSIGTYVSPRIYVGYGYNMLEKTSEFNGLFTITPRIGIGTDVGEADNNLNITFTHEN